MNVKNYIITGVICFFVGAIGSGLFTGITIHQYSQNRLDHYEKLIADAREDNRTLERELQSAIDRNRELESTIVKITESVERINRSSGKISIIINELDRITIEIRKIIEKYD